MDIKNKYHKVNIIDFMKRKNMNAPLKELDYKNEFEFRPQDYIPHAKIANYVALFYNKELMHTSNYKHDLKRKLKPAIAELQKHEKDFLILEEALEDSTIATHDVYYDYIKEIASVPIWQMENMIAIIKALKKEPKAILGITKKILDK